MSTIETELDQDLSDLGPPLRPAPSGMPSDRDISEAYVYLLDRLLVLRQEQLDFEREGFGWNRLLHRASGQLSWPNPNLDVVYSEAWVAVDQRTCVLLELPRIEGRYYTWEMLNGWDEVILNINERTFPQQPYGRYALCLAGASPKIPEGALRVDLPTRTSRVLARIEIGNDLAGAERLQRAIELVGVGRPKLEPKIEIPMFTLDRLPGVEAFDQAEPILGGEPDLNPGMERVRAQVEQVAALVRSGPAARARVDEVVRHQSVPEFLRRVQELSEAKNGWVRAMRVGNYGTDYWTRSMVSFAGLWANNSHEVVSFAALGLDGSAIYTQRFAREALPEHLVRYFWSVIAVDTDSHRVIPNALDRFLLNRSSGLELDGDGGLTLVYAPARPAGHPEANWLPTPRGQRYDLTFRFYGPNEALARGAYFPPALVEVR